MIKQTILFDKSRTELWNSHTKDLISVLAKVMEAKQSCLITIEKFTERRAKSYQQLKGFHRLIDILVPYFKEWTGEYWDRHQVKDFIKFRNGYTVRCKGIEVSKSCKEATIENMRGLIEEVTKFAAEMGIENCYLTSEEEKQLIEYYNER